MKRFFIALLGLAAISFFSFRTLTHTYADVLAALGIPPALAKDHLSNSFIGGYFSQPQNPAYKRYPAGKRAEAVQQLGMFTKNYLMSAEFRKRYMEHYEQIKPQAPKSLEERIQEQIADYKKMIRENEESYKKVGDNLKPVIQNNIKGLQDFINMYEDKNHPKHNKQMQIMQMGYDGDMQNYQQRLAELEKKFPKDIKLFIKARLQEFLLVSADVDFNAELVQDGKKKKFANPEYERKSTNWKYCFRAGKETIESARAFAQQWLKEL